MCKFYKMLSLNKPNPKAESIERVRSGTCEEAHTHISEVNTALTQIQQKKKPTPFL